MVPFSSLLILLQFIAGMSSYRQVDYEKMSDIFHAFDRDRDGKLNEPELACLIKQSNPCVQLSAVQLGAIVEEVRLDGCEHAPVWTICSD